MNARQRLIWENVCAAGNEKCTISDGRYDINPTNQNTILWRLIYICVNCKNIDPNKINQIW